MSITKSHHISLVPQPSYYPSPRSTMLYAPASSTADFNSFSDLYFIKTLSTTKFPVHVVYSPKSAKNYAMKVFSTKGEKSILYFLNEIRFASLQHPNIIKILHCEQAKVSPNDRQLPSKASYTLMEFAQYGDLFDFTQKFRGQLNDKFIRTYFRQLIEGVEYLHDHSVAHLDLKLDNLLIGDDYMLKIADFDLSYIAGDKKVYSKGTRFYRAPEMIEGKCKDYWATDVHAIGIILFTMKTRGMLPHSENKTVMGVNLFKMLYEDNERFWSKHEKMLGETTQYFDEDFRVLFNSLVELDPSMRPTVKEIKKSKWYNGPVYTKEELRSKCRRLYGY